MAAHHSTLRIRQALTGRWAYWVMLGLLACLLGLAGTQAPALVLALVLLGLILLSFLQSLVKRDYFRVLSWVCLGYLGFAFGGLFYATSSGPIFEQGYYISKNGRIVDIGPLVYASLPENRYKLALALLLAILGLCSFAAGYVVLVRRRTRSDVLAVSEPRWSRRRLFLAVSLLSIMGLAFTYLFFQSSGGFLYLLRHIYGRAVFRSTAYLNWGILLLPTANLLWFTYDYGKARRNVLFWFHMLLTSVVLVSLGDRWGVLGFWLMLVTVHYYRSRRSITLRGLAVLGGAVVCVTMLVGAWRLWATTGQGSLGTDLQSLAESVAQTFRTILAGRNLTDIDVLAWILGPGHEQIGWLAGKSFLQAVLAPIPRSLFPAKPDDLGYVVFRTYTETDFLNSWHPSFVGELYLNFMLPGVVAGMFALGLVSAWIERRRVRSSRPDDILLYAIYTAKFVILLVTVDFLMSFLQAILYAIPVFAASLYINRTRIRLR
jgi:hypothetical protein